MIQDTIIVRYLVIFLDTSIKTKIEFEQRIYYIVNGSPYIYIKLELSLFKYSHYFNILILVNLAKRLNSSQLHYQKKKDCFVRFTTFSL